MISCARRRATSAHAAARCACARWVMSSNTTTQPAVRAGRQARAPQQELLRAAAVRRARAAAPIRPDPPACERRLEDAGELRQRRLEPRSSARARGSTSGAKSTPRTLPALRLAEVQPQVLVEGEHAGGEVGEYAFEVGLGLRELGLVALGRGARIRELQRHAVERLRSACRSRRAMPPPRAG